MKNLLLCSIVIAALLPSTAAAQSMEAGVMFGVSELANESLEFEFEDRVREAFLGFALEDTDVMFKVKAGRVDTTAIFADGNIELEVDGEVEYINALVEYRFSEVFGSTSIFAGPGFYQQQFGDFKQQDYGVSAGINGIFPLSRRVGFIAEAAYHWANFEPKEAFVTVAGGLKLNF